MADSKRLSLLDEILSFIVFATVILQALTTLHSASIVIRFWNWGFDGRVQWSVIVNVGLQAGVMYICVITRPGMKREELKATLAYIASILELASVVVIGTLTKWLYFGSNAMTGGDVPSLYVNRLRRTMLLMFILALISFVNLVIASEREEPPTPQMMERMIQHLEREGKLGHHAQQRNSKPVPASQLSVSHTEAEEPLHSTRYRR